MTGRPVRLGVVGLGDPAKRVVRRFSAAANCQLAAIGDRDGPALFEQQRVYLQPSPGELLNELAGDDALDAVALATPPATHLALAKAVLLAGKHVYIEQPLALSAGDAQALVDLAQLLNRKLMLGALLEQQPAVEVIKRQLDCGALGEINFVFCQQRSAKADQQPRAIRQPENARRRLAPHDIALILELFAAEPDDVSARHECYPSDGLGVMHLVHLHFPGDRLAQLHASGGDPYTARKVIVVGSQGMLVCDCLQSGAIVRMFDTSRSHVGGREILIPNAGGAEPLAWEAAHFVECILHDSVPRNNSLRVLRVLEQLDRHLLRRPEIATFSPGRQVA